MDPLIPQRLAATIDRIEAAAQRSGRAADDIQLLAVTKGHPAAIVAAAYEAGHRQFGESKAQELQAKAAELPADIEWHFIGPLQRNKVKIVRPLAVALHSLDRDALAVAWGAGPSALVQIRLGGEPTKHGYEPEDAFRAVEHAIGAGVPVVGLMTIPPPAGEGGEPRRWFAALRMLRDEIVRDFPSVRHLSMGMSDDFEDAIEQGATMVRVGSAIFGPRNQH